MQKCGSELQMNKDVYVSPEGVVWTIVNRDSNTGCIIIEAKGLWSQLFKIMENITNREKISKKAGYE